MAASTGSSGTFRLDLDEHQVAGLPPLEHLTIADGVAVGIRPRNTPLGRVVST